MTNFLTICLALHAIESQGLRLTQQNAQRPATLEFLSGWSKPAALLEDWMPNYTEPNTKTMLFKGSSTHDGIAFISPTYHGNLKAAASVQDSWEKFLNASDLILNVVDPDCQEDKRLDPVIILPSELFKNCKRTFENKIIDCNGHHKANVKHIFGIVHMARMLKEKNASVWPEWWIMKDDDTYINVHNLKTDLAARDSSKPVMLAAVNRAGFFGGSGIALSWPLVEQMALNHGSAWINEAVNRIDNTKEYWFWWDVWMPQFIKRKLNNAELIDDKNFQYSLQGCGNNFSKSSDTGSECHLIQSICDCTRSDAIAVWHLNDLCRKNISNCVQILETYEKKTRALAA